MIQNEGDWWFCFCELVAFAYFVLWVGVGQGFYRRLFVWFSGLFLMFFFFFFLISLDCS
jgi:hypothetical protein